METILLEYQGTFEHGRTLDSIVDIVDSLPPLPEVASRVLRLLDEPDSTPDEIAEVLRRDPVLASLTLRVANSAALGGSESVSELPQAIMVVGLSVLKWKLLAATLKNWRPNPGPIDKLIWEKSLGTAAAAQVLAAYLDKPYQSEAQLSGLLHNLGQMVMLADAGIRKEYPGVIEYIRKNQVDFAEAERNVIGFSYPLVGALIAKRWSLPYSTCLCILRHNDPFESIETRQDEQIALTQLASVTAMCAGFGCPEGHPLFGDASMNVAFALGFDPVTIENEKEVFAGKVKALYAREASEFAK